MAKLTRSVVIPDYEKIRRFVISEVARAGNVPMRLASNREIAKQFNVSHPTVIKALKDLVADGYLTVKPGSLGTYTNPGRFSGVSSAKLIGLLRFNGKTVFELRFSSAFIHAFNDALLRKSAKYLLQHCFLTGESKNAPSELEGLNLDAIVWFFPLGSAVELMDEISEKGMTTVYSSDGYYSGAAVYIDHAAINFEVAQRMLSEGRRDLLLVLPDCSFFRENAIEGVARAFTENGLEFNSETSVVDISGFKGYIEQKKPEGIIFNHDPLDVWPVVEKYLEFKSKCRLYALDLHIRDDMNYSGFVGVPDVMVAGQHMAEYLIAKFEGRSVAPPQPIEVTICPLDI